MEQIKKNQSSVEWLVEQINHFIYFIPMNKWDEIKGVVQQAKAMQQEQAQQYAEFCIRCDRESLPILDFNSWIAHNETFGGNNEQQ